MAGFVFNFTQYLDSIFGFQGKVYKHPCSLYPKASGFLPTLHYWDLHESIFIFNLGFVLDCLRICLQISRHYEGK